MSDQPAFTAEEVRVVAANLNAPRAQKMLDAFAARLDEDARLAGTDRPEWHQGYGAGLEQGRQEILGKVKQALLTWESR